MMFLKKITAILFLLLNFGFYFHAGAQETLDIMPLGNSITRGSMCLNGDIYNCQSLPDDEAIGYRHRLYNLLEAAGYNIDFVGKKKFGWEIMDDPDNTGFGGIRSGDLADVIENGTSSFTGQVTSGPYLESYHADIILLHIGTNDILAGNYGVTNVSRLLDAVDDYETSSGNDVLVIVSTIISQANYPCHTHNGTKTFNSNLNSMVQNRKNSGDLIEFIDMECNANLDYSNDLIDQVHPNQTGYDKMADLWFETINNFNNAPLVSSIPDQERFRGEAFNTISLDSYVTDIEDSPQDITWTTVPLYPENFTVSIDQNRVATITPKDALWSGTESIEFVATDKGKIIEALKKSDKTTVQFTVKWTPEIIGQNTLTTPEDTDITIGIDDLIIVEPEKAPAGLSLIVENGPEYSVAGTTITPANNFFGTLTVPVKLDDSGKESNTFNLEIEVGSENDIPVIDEQVETLTVIQGECTTIPLSAFAVTDADNAYPDDFSLNIVSGSNYTSTLNNLCPAPSFSGMLSVNVRVNDGSANSDVYVAQVEVLAVNPVIILPSNQEVLEEGNYAESISIDHYEPESFTVTVTTLPEWMGFNSSTLQLQGSPGNEHVGENEVSFRVSDGNVTVDTSMTITVINVNDPPVITSLPVTSVKSGMEYNYVFSAEDIDPFEILTYTAVEIPSWAYFNASTGHLTGTPTREQSGVYNVTLRVSDGEVSFDQNFNLEVIYNNFPPIITTDPLDTIVVGNTYTYGIVASDPEGDPVSYFAKSIPDWLTFYESTRVLIGVPEGMDAGSSLIVMAATDGIDTTYQAYNLEVSFHVGVFGMEQIPAARVYPNPSNGILRVELMDAERINGNLYFEIRDLTGRLVMNEVIRSSRMEFILDQKITAGVYLYSIYDQDKIRILQNGKLMVK